jgi:hypothetical protein
VKYHQKRACIDCPFSKHNTKVILTTERLKQILKEQSFTCHKKRDLQCAGHMLINRMDNEFYRMAKIMRYELQLEGHQEVFKSHDECIQYHAEKMKDF